MTTLILGLVATEERESRRQSERSLGRSRKVTRGSHQSFECVRSVSAPKVRIKNCCAFMRWTSLGRDQFSCQNLKHCSEILQRNLVVIARYRSCASTVAVATCNSSVPYRSRFCVCKVGSCSCELCSRSEAKPRISLVVHTLFYHPDGLQYPAQFTLHGRVINVIVGDGAVCCKFNGNVRAVGFANRPVGASEETGVSRSCAVLVQTSLALLLRHVEAADPVALGNSLQVDETILAAFHGLLHLMTGAALDKVVTSSDGEGLRARHSLMARCDPKVTSRSVGIFIEPTRLGFAGKLSC